MKYEILEEKLKAPINTEFTFKTYNENYKQRYGEDIIFHCEDLRKKTYSRPPHHIIVEHHIVNTLNKTGGFSLTHFGKKGGKFDAIDAACNEDYPLRVEFKTLTYLKKLSSDFYDKFYDKVIECIKNKDSKSLAYHNVGRISYGMTVSHMHKHKNKIDYFVFFLNLEDRDVFFCSKFQPDVTANICFRNSEHAHFRKCERNVTYNNNYNDLFKCDMYVVKDNSIVHYEGERNNGGVEEIYKHRRNQWRGTFLS
jgi:hypothetical protein